MQNKVFFPALSLSLLCPQQNSSIWASELLSTPVECTSQIQECPCVHCNTVGKGHLKHSTASSGTSGHTRAALPWSRAVPDVRGAVPDAAGGQHCRCWVTALPRGNPQTRKCQTPLLPTAPSAGPKPQAQKLLLNLQTGWVLQQYGLSKLTN